MSTDFETEVRDSLGKIAGSQSEMVGAQNTMNQKFSDFMIRSEPCAKKCKATHNAIFGTENINIQTKVLILWGVSGLALSGVVAIIITLIKNSIA